MTGGGLCLCGHVFLVPVTYGVAWGREGDYSIPPSMSHLYAVMCKLGYADGDYSQEEGVVRYHCGGWPEEVNTCFLNSYMVYL
jgi:hypothetical protein